MAAQTLRYHQYLGLLTRSHPFVGIAKNAPVYLVLLCCRKLAFCIDFTATRCYNETRNQGNKQITKTKRRNYKEG
nr:MAG TPA: hypothetical protein [Caudoviricetes sp.]